MMESLVSIVLPIYNVSNFLDRCMNSVVNQTYRNIEIIMVDDGSTDGSSEICDSWKLNDKRVKVVHKTNEGLGYARNTGILNATGDYIFFWDSDDYVKTDLVERCVEKQKEDNADIVLYGFSRVDSNGKEYDQVIPTGKKNSFSSNEIPNEILPALLAGKGNSTSGLWMSAWACMYSKKLIDQVNWKFVSEREIIAEDVFSLLQLYAHVKTVSIINDKLYYYCDNNKSLTHVFKDDRLSKIQVFLDKTLEKSREIGYGGRIEKCIYVVYTSFLIGALKTIVLNPSIDYFAKRSLISKAKIDENCIRAISDEKRGWQKLKSECLFYSLRYKMVDFAYFLIKIRSNHI